MAALVPSLVDAVRAASAKAFAPLYGTLPPIDRTAAGRSFRSGEHGRHGMDVRVIDDPSGRLPRASTALPGALHDVRATCGHGVVDALAQAVPPCITPAQAQDEKSHRPVPEIAVVFPPCEPRSAFTWC
ncbi:hypothetical protein [Streptomyces prasinus]|uniref:hypothetical protein n=1 Tax=Streptomyces prasinus TaxID=67345 RepID=UPI003D9E16AF